MNKINDLINGIRTGEYWYVWVAFLLFVLSMIYLFRVESKEYPSVKEHNDAFYLAGRMIIASLAAEAIAVESILLSGIMQWLVLIATAIIGIYAMIRIDKLPIWEER